MESRRLLSLLFILALAACQGGDGTGVANGGGNNNNGWNLGPARETSYWHQKNITADNTPDIIKAQDILEEDLTACGYEKRARNHMARMNDPVSTPDGHVVDQQGTPRKETSLPTSYSVRECMERKGWVKLKHYYTTPY